VGNLCFVLVDVALMTLALPQPLTTCQRVGILGLSRSGVAAARLAKQAGVSQVILSNPTLPNSPEHLAWADELKALGVMLDLGQHHDIPLLALAEVIVLSPGIAPSAPVVQQLTGMGLPLISELDWAFAFAPSHWRWLAITGTNGKTTVTTLLHHLLSSLGYHAELAGNIGIAPSDVVLKHLNRSRQAAPNPLTLVTEVSSYQLAQSQLFAPSLGLITNVQPDHLAWHGSFSAYSEAKARLLELTTETVLLNVDDPTVAAWADRVPPPKQVYGFATQAPQPNGLSVIARATSGQLTLASPGAALTSSPAQASLAALGWALPGEHNASNLAACLAALLALAPQLGLPTQPQALLGLPALQQALADFKGVEHRLEPVATVQGVRVVNDSKATNPEASRLALLALAPSPLWLLAGGDDKGTDLSAWAATAAATTQGVVVYGAAKQRLAQALRLAQAGDTVVLSPACASFDAFRDFEHRGHYFKQLVAAWVQRHGEAPTA
jgi:UDP-N-acetylmuramoylalanine--D-glutamate ligase